MTVTISKRVQSMMRMTMADMADLADARPGAFRLENADSYLVPPEHVLAATRDAVGVDDFNSYLPLRGLAATREAVARRFREDFGLEYDPEGEIVISSGAGESLLNALLVAIDPGDRVLLTNPTYSGMAQRVRLSGGVQTFCDLDRGQERWSLDLDRLREAARGCRAIFFASPCMPTGTVFTREETQALADAAVENDAVVIFNGHAERLVFDGREVVHPATLPGLRERTIAIGTVSKDYGMPGWRIGWAAAPRELAGALEDAHIFNGIMPNGFAQAGATAALSEPQDWQRELVATFQANRDALLEELREAPGVSAVPAEGGYYFVADVEETGLTADEFCERALAEHDVAVTPMRGWGSDDFGRFQVRFIFTNEPEERLREAGRRVAELARSLTA
jgi:aspartate/methionine/tyrosine aminotransferase